MNVFLIIVLVLSGLVELIVGLWALLVTESFANLWLGTTNLSGPLGILIFVVGLACIYMAALHVLAIRWLQLEKQEGYHLSIALGCATTVFAVATCLRAQWFADLAVSTAYLLLVDGLRGGLVTLAGITALRAPATVRDLRVPGRTDGSAARRDRDGYREGREGRSRRSRDRDRPTRHGEQRRRTAGREAGGRPSRSRRDAGRIHGGSAERSDRAAVRGRETAIESTEPPGALRRRRLNLRENGSEESDRRQVRPPRAPAMSETEDARNLGIVVTGRRPDQRQPAEPDEDRSSRSEPRGGKEEKRQRPLAPMVPSLRTEDGRSRRSDREIEDDERDARGDRPRSRHRRRRPVHRDRDRDTDREANGRGPLYGGFARSDESVEQRFPSSDDSRPSGNRLVERTGLPDPPASGGGRPNRDLPAPEPAERPIAFSAPLLPEEPIDRISVFHSIEEKDSEEPVEGDGASYGRNRRPFTQHRKSRQVKPRETKNRQSLGGDHSKETADPPATYAANQPESRTRPIGMENGIGPIDLDEPDLSGDLSGEE